MKTESNLVAQWHKGFDKPGFMKKYLSSIFIVAVLLLSRGSTAFASTDIDTPTSRLREGTGTWSASGATTLDTFTSPTLATDDVIKLHGFTSSSSGTSAFRVKLGTTNISLGNVPSGGNTRFECIIFNNFDSSNQGYYECNYVLSTSTTINVVHGSNATTFTSPFTIEINQSSGSSAAQRWWTWQVYRYKGADQVTTITEGGPVALNDLTDVTISTPADNQSLTYDATSTTWINETVSGGGGGTPTMEYLTEEIFWNLVNSFAALFVFGFAFIVLLFGIWFFYHKSRYQ